MRSSGYPLHFDLAGKAFGETPPEGTCGSGPRSPSPSFHPLNQQRHRKVALTLDLSPPFPLIPESCTCDRPCERCVKRGQECKEYEPIPRGKKRHREEDSTIDLCPPASSSSTSTSSAATSSATSPSSSASSSPTHTHTRTQPQPQSPPYQTPQAFLKRRVHGVPPATKFNPELSLLPLFSMRPKSDAVSTSTPIPIPKPHPIRYTARIPSPRPAPAFSKPAYAKSMQQVPSPAPYFEPAMGLSGYPSSACCRPVSTRPLPCQQIHSV